MNNSASSDGSLYGVPPSENMSFSTCSTVYVADSESSRHFTEGESRHETGSEDHSDYSVISRDDENSLESTDGDATETEDNGERDALQSTAERLQISSMSEAEVLPIVEVGESNNVIFHAEYVKEIFFSSAIKDMKVALVSIAGQFGDGKSFFMKMIACDLFPPQARDDAQLRSMESWLKRFTDKSMPSLFQWRGSRSNGHTKGFWILNKPYIYKIRDGDREEDIAIFFADAQGLYDKGQLAHQILQLSLLCSSCQIMNFREKLPDIFLEDLHLAIEKCKLADDKATFQSIHFLLRDFNDHHYEYGFNGGFEFLNDQLSVESMVEVYDALKLHFDKIECFLMPHPGQGIASARDYSQLDPETINTEFIFQYYEYLDAMLMPDQLAVKRINGEPVNAEQLGHYILKCMDLLKNGELTASKSTVEKTAIYDYNLAHYKADKIYKNAMRKIKKDYDPVDWVTFNKASDEAYDKAMNTYINEKKIGGKKYLDRFLPNFVEGIKIRREKYRAINDDKIKLRAVEIEEEKRLLSIGNQSSIALPVAHMATSTGISNSNQDIVQPTNEYNAQLSSMSGPQLKREVGRLRTKIDKAEEKVESDGSFYTIMGILYGIPTLESSAIGAMVAYIEGAGATGIAYGAVSGAALGIGAATVIGGAAILTIAAVVGIKNASQTIYENMSSKEKNA